MCYQLSFVSEQRHSQAVHQRTIEATYAPSHCDLEAIIVVRSTEEKNVVVSQWNRQNGAVFVDPCRMGAVGFLGMGYVFTIGKSPTISNASFKA